MAAGEVVADAEAEAAEGVGAQFLDDVGEAVVSAVGALFAHTDSAQRQGNVVVDNQKVLDGNLLLIQPIFHRLAAQVHIGGGLDDHQGLTPEFHLRHLG